MLTSFFYYMQAIGQATSMIVLTLEIHFNSSPSCISLFRIDFTWPIESFSLFRFFFSISIGFLMKFSKKFCDMRAFEIGRY